MATQFNRKTFLTEAEKKPSVSYWAKEDALCPVCRKKFRQELMHQGGGRTIAGNLTDELHRNYEPSKKYGRVYPLIYEIGCCPHCHTALFWKDFKDIKDPETFDRIMQDEQHRIKEVEAIFPHYDLNDERTLYDGTAMYCLCSDF